MLQEVIVPGTLYLVATPIGNLADISLRALSTLKEVDLIAAEDTRVTRKLLAHYDIATPMTPYHQHSVGRKAEHLLDLLREGKSIAMVSDAGTPGVSDPGHELIAFAIENGISVVAIPGANAIITALIVSGLSTRRFTFEGFPPRPAGERRTYFQALENEPRTMIFYESPMRLLATLKSMLEVLGDRRVAVVREATKMFEEVHRGTLTSAIERFAAVKAKGEITLVLEGSVVQPPGISDDRVEDSLRRFLGEGLSERDAVRQVTALYSLPRKEVYARMLKMKQGDANHE